MSISYGDRSTHARHTHGPCGVAFAGEIIGPYHIAWPKAARRAIANANLHCPRQDEDILAARGDVPVTKVVGGKTPKDDIGAGLNRHILDVGGRDMQVFERMAGCSAFGTSVSGNAAVLVISPASIAFTTSAA